MAGLEAARAQFESMNTTVLAINPASIKSHQDYCDKKGYSFPILSDPGGKTVGAFDCHKLLGKGVARTVYALDPEGKVIFAERGQASYEAIMETIKSAE